MKNQGLRGRKRSRNRALQALVRKRQKTVGKADQGDGPSRLGDKGKKKTASVHVDIVGDRPIHTERNCSPKGTSAPKVIPDQSAGRDDLDLVGNAVDEEDRGSNAFVDVIIQSDSEGDPDYICDTEEKEIEDDLDSGQDDDGSINGKFGIEEGVGTSEDPDFVLSTEEESSEDNIESALPGDDVDEDLRGGNSHGGNRNRSSRHRLERTVATTAKTGKIRGGDADEEFNDDEEENLGFEVARIDYDAVAGRLQSMIRERNFSGRNCPKKPKRKSLGRNMPLNESHKSVTSIRGLWIQAVRRLRERNPDFFTSRQARLEEEETARKGKPAYASVPISQFNNCDLQSIFATEYDRKVKQGGSYSSFLQLVTVAGQYLRLCVVRGLTTVGSLWEQGQLFHAIGDMNTVDLFLSHYDARAQCTTVMTKALHLRKIAEHAKLHFMDGDRTSFANAERARVKLQKVFNAQKSLARSLATRKKQMDERCAEGSVFLDHDFERCCKIVRRSLDGMLQTFEEVKEDSSMAEAMQIVERSDFIRKWYINFMLLLLFAAGGQRPQTYTKLQAPDEGELSEMKEQASKMHFFEVKTLFEKTRRSLDMPNVLIPEHVMKYFEFHVNVMRAVVLRRAEVDESECTEKPLLMHTEHGTELRRSQVTSCLRSFLSYHVPEMKSITVMALRSSYGTITMQAFRRKKIFRGMSEEEFLNILAKYMNTSPEQLMTTYIGIDRSDFESTARELVRVLDFTDRDNLETNDQDDDGPSTVGNGDVGGISYESIFGSQT